MCGPDPTIRPDVTRPPTTAGLRSDARLPHALALLGLLGIGVALPLLLGTLSGSIVIPHNDDPSMRRVALEFLHTGRLELNGWTSMTLVGQIAFVQPFLWVSDGGPWAFATATMSLAVVGIVAGFLLVRRVLSVPRATMAVLGVLLFPGFLLNTTTFMTDVPAWAGSIACLALGAAALDRQGRDRWRWLVASLVVGCFAFSIREFAIAAPVAVLVANGAAENGSRRPYLVAGGVLLAVCGAIYLYAVHLPGQHEAPPELISATTVRGVQQAFATLALVLSPALVLAAAGWWRRWRLPEVAIGGAIGLAVFHDAARSLLRSGSPGNLLVGNLLEAAGNLGAGTLAGGRPTLYPALIWHALSTIALVAAVGLCAIAGGALGAYLRRSRRGLQAGRGRHAFAIEMGSTKGLLAVFATLYAGGIFSWGFAVIMFDRYLWLLALPLYALLLSRPDPSDRPAKAPVGAGPPASASPRPVGLILERIAILLSAILLAGLGLTSLALLANADAFEAARWRMGELAVARGIPPGTVDAGLEWVTFHATGVAKPYARAPAGWSRYDAWWPSFHLCAMASAAPLDRPDLELIQADPKAYRLLLFGGPIEPLFLYRVSGVDCP
jgi:Dolichyl-phosphate-mannose-protein mannosyltransferase